MIKIADFSDLNEIVNLRVYQQIEDWNNTNHKKDYSVYAKSFYKVTKEYLSERLNKDIVFALRYTDGKAVSLCGLQVKESLSQITVCENGSEKSAELVSVYTVPDCRERIYAISSVISS